MKKFIFLLAFSIIFILPACNGKQDHKSHGLNLIEDADLIAIYERENFDEVFIVNTRGEEVAHYVLVEKGDTSNYELPEGAVEIRVPLENVVIDSEVYTGALEQLDATGVVSGLFDANYATSPAILELLKAGKIKDVGQSISPNLEKIVSLLPEAFVISYYDGMQTEGLDKLGIPLIKMYDLQESSPIERAEWIRFLARLTGKGEKGDSIFDRVRHDYKGIKSSVQASEKPKVLTEVMYNGIWSVAGGDSYQSTMIKDAGGNYFMEDNQDKVTVNLSPEAVLAKGGDADIWLIRYFGDGEELKNILKSDPVYGEIKAYKDGRIYYSDTSQSALFREFPFHPELLLEDYRIIFQGDSVNKLRYFKLLDLN